MISKKRLGALLLAGTMIMGMCTTALGAQQQEKKITITKNFEMAAGLSVPNVKFDFTAECEVAGAPEAVIESVSYNLSDMKKEPSEGKYIISKDTEISFKGEFPHAGEYVYTIKETDGQAEGITYSKDEYKLHIYVINGENGVPEIREIVVKKNGEKVGDKGILFTNTYRGKGTLTLEKEVKGTGANPAETFPFYIEFKKSATEETLSPISATLTKADGTVNNFIVYDVTDLQLAGGDKVVFKDIPAGTWYKIIEKGKPDGYTASATIIVNGEERKVDPVGDSDDLCSSLEGDYIHVDKNKVIFTNTFTDTPITGIIVNNLPFILLIGIAVLAFGTLAFVKKRRTSK